MHFTIEEFIIVWTRIDQVTFLDRLVLRLQINTPALLLGLHIKMHHKTLFILQKQVRIKKIVARWLAGVKCLANGPSYDSQWSWRSFSLKKNTGIAMVESEPGETETKVAIWKFYGNRSWIPIMQLVYILNALSLVFLLFPFCLTGADVLSNVTFGDDLKINPFITGENKTRWLTTKRSAFIEECALKCVVLLESVGLNFVRGTRQCNMLRGERHPQPRIFHSKSWVKCLLKVKHQTCL